MNLSVIINHHRTPDLLKECLGSLEKNLRYPAEEIIVADSESDPGIVFEIQKFFPAVKFICFEKNIGYGASNNAALKKAKGDYILIINADVAATAGGTEAMLDYLEKTPDAGLIGPRLLNKDGSFQQSCFRFYTPAAVLARRTLFGKTKAGKKINDWFLMRDKDLNSGPVEADWIMGSVLLARREALDKVSLFDERFFMYFDDVDWARRFWENGYRVVYFPQAVFYHHHIKASDKLGPPDAIFNFYTRIHIASAVKYFWKWGVKYNSKLKIQN